MQAPDHCPTSELQSERNAAMCQSHQSVVPADASRRSFMLLGMGLLLAGCAEQRVTTMLPGPAWRPRELPPIDEKPIVGSAPPTLPDMPGNVIPRTQWASGAPATALMNRMLPVQFITVHHDGMEPFYATDQSSSAARLDSIRRAHRDKGWGDIGYHFAIDRDGRVWQCRPLAWQGAHVKDCNEGNIGVVSLGNFDRQSPSAPQIAGLNRHVSWLMRQFHVPLRDATGRSKVLTHQEWPSARTACPGVNLQRYMVAVRNNRQIG